MNDRMTPEVLLERSNLKKGERNAARLRNLIQEVDGEWLIVLNVIKEGCAELRSKILNPDPEATPEAIAVDARTFKGIADTIRRIYYIAYGENFEEHLLPDWIR